MSVSVSGNLRGLNAAQVRRVGRLYGRRIPRSELVSLELARELCSLAEALRRRIGVLVSRSGDIEEVFIGTREMLYLPDLGRYRFGRGRLRRLRLIFSDLGTSREPVIPGDILHDLEALRLDTVVSVRVRDNHTAATYAYIIPSAQVESPTIQIEIINELSLFDFDFAEFIDSLENELAGFRRQTHVIGKLSTVLVGVYDKRFGGVEVSMRELEDLARTAGLNVVDRIIQRRTPDPRTLLGKGKMQEVILRCQRVGTEMMVFDTELRPSQWRAITNSTDLRVIDRSMLILDIFAQRARSSEGRLQVELAQLRYNLPRLVEMDAGLSRLTGGIGGRGPGETKLELGRRRTRERIAELESRIDHISEQRGLRRSRREANLVPLVPILGYTNVGKSSLFNLLTGSSVLVEDKLFATLDPAQRQMVVPFEVLTEQTETSSNGAERWMDPRERTLILSDTVGFIQNLPAALMSAFRATLEELYSATLLVHVVDASDPEIRERKDTVDGILREMGLAHMPTLMVLNKIDLIDSLNCAKLCQSLGAIGVSAQTGAGITLLQQRLFELVIAPRRRGQRANGMPAVIAEP